MGKGVRRTDYQMLPLPAADEAAVVCQRVPWGPIDYHLDARIWVAEWLQRGCLEASRRARGARFPCESVVDRRGVEPLTSAVQRPSSLPRAVTGHPRKSLIRR